MNKKFFLSLFCDYTEDTETGKIDYVLSKGNLICWFSFLGLLSITVGLLMGIQYNSTNLPIVVDVLKNTFTTTFMYSIAKRGISTYENIKVSNNEIEK